MLAYTRRRATAEELAAKGRVDRESGMERPEAIQLLRAECNLLSATVTRMHPIAPSLQDAPTQAEIFKALFELTKNVETVKKQLMRLERRDDSELT